MKQPVNTSSPLEKGAQLGQYTVLERIGAGGMGEVYRARDTRLSRDVAIKVLPSFLSNDSDRLRRFEQEARAAAALNHPNILAIYQMGAYDGAPYLVSELLEGSTLREQLARGPMPLRKVIDYGVQIAHGLAAAHEKGIVHRDLKPENLFVTKDGRVKILDFGLAKLTQPNWPVDSQAPTASKATDPGVVMGTVGYMAPEQVSGKPADHHADIFAFGAVLYEMLTGKRAFQKATSVETMSAILNEDPPSVSQLAWMTPPALERLVHHCLEKDPEQRFHSASDLAFALKALSESGSVSPAPIARWQRKSRIVVVSAGAVAALVVVLFAFNVAGLRDRVLRRGTVGLPKVESIAVLPLENFSRDPDQEYFADGMTEALIADLSKINALRVISRTSVVPYKNVRKPLPEIARELRVDAVVEGSVERAGDRVKIIVQLVDAQNDRNLWSNSYDCDLRDVLSVQDRVAQAIAGEIRVQLRPQESAGLAKGRPVDPKAYEAYLRGRYFWNKRTPDDLRKAIDEFKKAIDLDPTYALAWAGLADGYSMLSDYDEQPPRETIPLAKAAARKALEIDDSLGEPRVTLADIEWTYDWNLSAAETDFERAIALSPNYASAHQWYGMYLCSRGRSDHGIVELERAQTLDPLSLVIGANLGRCRYYARHYEQAVELLKPLEQREPEYWIVHALLGQTYLAMGRLDVAIRELERARALLPESPRNVGVLGDAYGRGGRRADALNLAGELAGLSRKRYVPPVYRAMIYVGLGESGQAMAFLERAYADRSDWMVLLDSDPEFDSLRSNPRFRDLLHRIAQSPE